MLVIVPSKGIPNVVLVKSAPNNAWRNKMENEKYFREPRLATARELQLLQNVLKAKQRGATQDQERLADYSKKKLVESLKAA